MLNLLTRSSAAFLLFAGLTCAQQQPEPQGQRTMPVSTASATRPNETTNPDVPPPGVRNPRYHIQPSDVLELTFPIATEFNQKVRVQPDGFISLQGAGSISILGLTMPQVVEAIKKAYVGILNDPIIDVDLVEFQRPYFIVTGQVGKPGQYDLRTDVTVSQAIAIAGGFAPTAKTQVFLYRRNDTGWVEAKEMKLKDFLHGKNIQEDIDIRPGDMIFVPEKTITKIRKYIPYSVGTSFYSGNLGF